MAMLISKFHRLIQSRLLWGAFLVIIVFSFVIWGTKMPGQARSEREARAEGMLNGKPIPPEEFQRAYFNSRLAFGLMSGRMPSPSAEFEKELRHTAWQRVASLHKAQELGMANTTDAEVIGAIQGQPAFQTEGRFNEGRYATFVRNNLAELGVNELQFEDYLREEILLEKLRIAVAGTLLIPPADVRQAAASLSDQFRVEYAVITPDTNAGAHITIKDAQALFDRDPKAYTIPDKVTVKYVEFPYSNYVASATVSVDEAVNYYNEHMERYTHLVSVTNPPPFGTTNAAPTVTKRSEQIPFDQVKTNIFATLKIDAARTRAADVASEFVSSLAPDRHGKCLGFDEAAAKVGRLVRIAGPFAEGEPVPAVESVPTFNRTAFALGTNADERFSDVVRGSDSVLVLYLAERSPTRVPAFVEVAARALEDARVEAKAKAQENKANRVRDAFAAAPASQPLAVVAQPFGLSTMTLTGSVLTVRGATNEYADVLLRGAMTRNVGEVCEVLRAYDGNLLVARVTERKPAEEAAVKAIQPQVFASVQRQRMRALDEAYAAYLLKEGKFTDRRTRLETETPEPSTPAPKSTVPADIY